MVKIRLKRMGAKKQAFYRIVVADANAKRDGKAIAELGFYDAVKNPAIVKIDEELALKWLSEVHNQLIQYVIYSQKKELWLNFTNQKENNI